MTRLALNTAIVLALALMVSACGKTPRNRNPLGPSNSGTVQIQNVEVNIPSGTVIPKGGGLEITISVWLSVNLPDSEYVSIHQCFSAERDKITLGCPHATSLDAGSLKRENPFQIREVSSGYSGYNGSDPTVINYIHILVFRGNDMRRIPFVSPIPQDTFALHTIEWKMIFM